MKVQCANCGHFNASHALYCASCGLVLERLPRRRTSRWCAAEMWTAAGVGATLLAVFGLFAMAVARRGWPGPMRHDSVRRNLVLHPAKADALYELLAPSDVRVLVGRSPRGLFVQGTPPEIETLERFTELLTRLEGLDRDRIESYMHRLRAAGLSRASYTLTPAKARSLVRALGFADVPVFVSRLGRTVTIRAEASDIEVIARLVDILRGRRLVRHSRGSARQRPRTERKGRTRV